MRKLKVISVVGIRPDLIRMSKVFQEFDDHFDHTIVHTGQHFSPELYSVFFKDLDIREPDINFEIGGNNLSHITQLGNLCYKIEEYKDLFRNSDLIVFLGDSNSVLAAPVLKKLGCKIAHIEAGMRSGDSRMLEEINRTICDRCCNVLFTYHPNYSKNLFNEGIKSNVFCVGNTILEVTKEIYDKTLVKFPKKNSHILIDIHRPENFEDPFRLNSIIQESNQLARTLNLPIYLLDFPRTSLALKNFSIDLGLIQKKSLMGFIDYLNFAYHSKAVISDSGTAQEELAIINTPVLVPRDFTERPESYTSGCSVKVKLDGTPFIQALESLTPFSPSLDWLGKGDTASKIRSIIQNNYANF